MTEMGLPALGGPEITDAERRAATNRLHDLVADGLSLEVFSARLEGILAAGDHDELRAALSGLPPVVRLTPAYRRSSQPVEVDAGTRAVRVGEGWQLGAETKVRSSTGVCHIDLTKASWDSLDVDLSLHTATGVISVIVPRGVAVQMRSLKGNVVTGDLEGAVPDAPVLRVSASAVTGVIVLRHPAERRARTRRRFWRRRTTSPRPAG